MTNSEKYLKDGVDVETFVREYLASRIYELDDWLNTSIKPTLTEDERVILRNIDKRYKTIERDEEGLIIIYQENGMNTCLPYDHLFQFIKERRRIRDKGVVKMIEKLKDSIILKDDCLTGVKPNNDQIVATINKIIDKVNELDIKLQTVKYFTPESEKAVKELLKLLEKDNSVGDVISGD